MEGKPGCHGSKASTPSSCHIHSPEVPDPPLPPAQAVLLSQDPSQTAGQPVCLLVGAVLSDWDGWEGGMSGWMDKWT